MPTADEAHTAGPKASSTLTDTGSVVSGGKTSPPAPPTPGQNSMKPGTLSGSGKGLILKGVSEKPTLVAKPPGPPTPVKSPWASLPPVEKVVPIAIDLQQTHQQQPRFTQRDSHGFDAMPPPTTKEIAADDFSRTWRDGNSNGNRELYNSQSGRYEPVNDARRASRTEGHGRQPAVLQRPMHGEYSGSAEPSAAFQTHRVNAQDGSFARRRASSNLSGNSGSFGRRMSKGQELHPGHDFQNARRGSLVAVSDAPSSPRNFSPSGQHRIQPASSQQPWTRPSPVVSHTSLASAHGQATETPAPSIPIEDEVALQKKIMRESRELARKRRLEEEAKEEAERKERIRLKLEAMGPAPETKKNKKETPKDEKVIPVQIQARDNPSTSTSPPKPPVPEVTGEIKQYGLMKVHPSEPVSTLAAPQFAEIKSGTSEARHNNSNNHTDATHKESLAQSNKLQHSHSQNGRQQWHDTTERFSTWGTAHAAQGRNVWGPPTNDKTLGNGTFNPDLSRLPEIHGSAQIGVGSGPGPIAPPSSSRINGAYQNRGREQYGQRPAPIGTPHRHQPLLQQEQEQRTQVKAAWSNFPEQIARDGTEHAMEQDRQHTLHPEPQVAGSQQTSSTHMETWTEDGIKTDTQATSLRDGSAPPWKGFPSKLPGDEVVELTRNDQESTARRQAQTNGIISDASQPLYKDVWRPPHLSADGSRNEFIAPPTAPSNGATSSTASPLIRGSRFFPSRDVRLEESSASFSRPGSSSPPPPTMVGHPAYDGDSLHPHVSFPRPSPIVKLPPPPVLAPIGPPKPTSFAAAVAAPIVSRTPAPIPYSPRNEAKSTYRIDPLTTAKPPLGGWQDRINSLIGRKSSPPKTHVLAVNSSSKSALELPATYPTATVSLPSKGNEAQPGDIDGFETKPMAEECFEEQEMGSLPVVRVPNKAPETAWHLAAPQQKTLPKRFLVSDSMTVDTQIYFPSHHLIVQLPGMEKPVIINTPRQKSNPRRQQGRGNTPRSSSSTHGRGGGRGRDASGGFLPISTELASTTPSSGPPSRTIGRGRGSVNNWNASHRHASTPNNAINV